MLINKPKISRFSKFKLLFALKLNFNGVNFIKNISCGKLKIFDIKKVWSFVDGWMKGWMRVKSVLGIAYIKLRSDFSSMCLCVSECKLNNKLKLS